MIDWLTAALIAMTLAVGIAVTDKYILSRFNPRLYTFIVGAVGLTSLFFLPLTVSPTPLQWLFGIGIGIIFSLSVYWSFVAYQKDEISRFAPLTMLSTIMITIGAAVFYGEHLSHRQYLAFALFLIGAFLLATRLETFVLFEGKTAVRKEEIQNVAMRTIVDPLGEGIYATEQLIESAQRVAGDWLDAAKNPEIRWIRFKRQLHLIKGLGWYLAGLALYIPYTLLAKDLNASTGVLAGWISIRTGIFIGAFFLMVGHWRHFRSLRRVRITSLAIGKEFVGMAVNYLILFASATGIVAIVQSLFAVEAVGVFLLSAVLAKFGIIKESLSRKDLIQKSVGVLFVAVATVLLFT